MEEDRWRAERLRMVKEQVESRGIRDPEVLRAMREIPRHLFVPEPLRRGAYEDHPLPIGEGQTISQPYIVALMTELLSVSAGSRVLEIGTGSGYQAALLAAIGARVVSIERLPGVAENARRNLCAAGFPGMEVIVGDGTEGYPPLAPYDAVIITAATPRVPSPLIDQMADGGRLVAPVGSRDIQELVRLVKHHGQIEEFRYGGVVFVPLLGRHGWQG